MSKAELAKVSGIADAEFVHKAGFTGGAWSKESVIKMAELSLAEHKAAQNTSTKAPSNETEKATAAEVQPEIKPRAPVELSAAVPSAQRERINAILKYWFGTEDSQCNEPYSAPSTETLRKWFVADKEGDKYIRANFAVDLKRLDRGMYKTWLDDHDGRLAAILLYDQFSRSVFRKSAKAYTYDRRAQTLTKKLLELDVVKDYRYMAQCFLLLPLVHAESKELGRLSVAEMRKVDKRMRTDPACK